MANQLDSAIQQIISRAAAEIAEAVRGNIADEIAKRVASLGASGKASAGKSAPKASAGKGAARSTPRASAAKRRGVTDEELAKVLEFIGKNPGKRGEEIRKSLGLDQDRNSKILAKLRETKKVKTKGDRRTTSYYVA